MAGLSLHEVDSIEITAIVDNELDPISPSRHSGVKYNGFFRGVHPAPLAETDRADARVELRMDNICCAAHGLSLMIVRQDLD